MKLKKLLALALAGVLMLALLTGCSGDGNGEDRLVAEAIADIPIDAGLHLDDFLRGSLKAYEQSNYVSFIAFDSTGMSAREQAEKFSSGVPSVGVYDKGVSPGANTKLRVGVCHKTVEGREYCLVVVVRAR